MSAPDAGSTIRGLTSAEAAARLAAEGANELPRQRARSLPRIALGVLREPMFGLLLAGGGVYLALGDAGEALVLLVFAMGSLLIAVIQEHRSERVLDALNTLAAPRALVVRDGERRRVAGRDVVRGDLVILGEGDRVPADLVLQEAADLLIDEALLTGESVPVRKAAGSVTDAAAAAPGGEDSPLAFAGTLIVRGAGAGTIFATGPASHIGRIGGSLAGIEDATPRLTREMRRFVLIVALLGLACCLFAFLLYGSLRGSWLQALLAGIALAMSMLPEEFPLVLTVFMVMGAWRLARIRVLTRRAAAIETLGSASLLCTDKTGTLTQNRMAIAELRAAGKCLDPVTAGAGDWTPALLSLLDQAVLASAPDPFDPMEKAFHALQAAIGVKPPPPPVKFYPLRPDLLAVIYARSREGGAGHALAAKGAPEAIIKLCRLAGAAAATARREADAMAARGLRVLAVAAATHQGALPESPLDLAFAFSGLAGLSDPLRAEVPGAVRECRAAGIRVVMITGDYPLTALAVAAAAGLPAGETVTGAEIAAMDGTALAQAAARASIFARIMPEQKLRLVEALRESGAVVAMTGDGVNDAPALKAADIGIAMGGRGADVAREAADIVLLDDDFGSIVRTIRLGRRIYDNLRKAMVYILAAHVPIAGMALLPLLTGWPLVFLPVHIAFLEMVIDPICSIAFEAEAEERNIMRRPPRAPKARLLPGFLLVWSLLQGLLAFAAVAVTYAVANLSGLPEGEVRTLTFAALVLVNLALVLVNRSFGWGMTRVASNPALGAIGLITLLLLAAAILLPPVKGLFRFGPFHWHDLGFVMATSAVVVLVLEILKRAWRLRLEGSSGK